jgi:hypothetical protein
MPNNCLPCAIARALPSHRPQSAHDILPLLVDSGHMRSFLRGCSPTASTRYVRKFSDAANARAASVSGCVCGSIDAMAISAICGVVSHWCVYDVRLRPAMCNSSHTRRSTDAGSPYAPSRNPSASVAWFILAQRVRLWLPLAILLARSRTSAQFGYAFGRFGGCDVFDVAVCVRLPCAIRAAHLVDIARYRIVVGVFSLG